MTVLFLNSIISTMTEKISAARERLMSVVSKHPVLSVLKLLGRLQRSLLFVALPLRVSS